MVFPESGPALTLPWLDGVLADDASPGSTPVSGRGPLLTTITDMAGFFLVLSLASLMMPLLLG